MKRISFLGGVLALAAGFSVNARSAELGMPAPDLSIAEWVKGQPVDLKAGQGKTIYVVEFWATWCPPCRRTIPMLTQLQKKYKDKQVVIVGVSDEPVATIKPFVQRMATNMDYTVAADKDGKTSRAYPGAFGINTIPHAFVVNKDGVIAWQGNPLQGLEGVLEELVSGRFDLALAKKLDQAVKLQEEYFRLVSAPGTNPRAAELGRQIVDGFSKTPGALDQFAWRLLVDRDLQARDLELALRAAKTAYDLTKGTDPSVLDTYARALFETGKREEAVKLEQAAIAVCKDERMRIEFQAALNRYQRLLREGTK
jgi:thiol-disulfide isomerase/thioredoxin